MSEHRSTGWAARRDQYAVPVLFNPYTGDPRDVRDVQSDPQGILIVPPGKVEMLAAKPTHQQSLQVDTPPAQPAPVAFEVGLVEWVGNKLMATPKVTTTPPASWMEMVTANLVREGVSKHKARELAEHFYGLSQPAPVQEPVPDYAWPTVADYEKDVGFEVNDAFKMAWGMARTTNALFTQVEKNNG